jgi:DNA-binding SARP family transcriptional activator
VSEIGRLWEGAAQAERALTCYRKCLEADSRAEGVCRLLMSCLQRLGRHAEAIDAYGRFRDALTALGVRPSEETRALYTQLVAAPPR